MEKLFLKENNIDIHIEEYLKNSDSYVSKFKELYENKDFRKTMTVNTRGMGSAIILNFRDRRFLNIKWELPDVLLGCEFLDTKRELKQLIKKSNRDENRINLLQNRNMDLSLSLAKIKIVRKWVKSIDEDTLITTNIFFNNSDIWRKLANLCHFRPGDFCVNWFLEYCYTGNYPNDSLMFKIKNANDAMLKNLYLEYRIPYEYIRLKNPSKEFKVLLAQKEPLRTVLWYGDELDIYKDNSIGDLVAERIKNERIDIPYTKIVQIIVNVSNKTSKIIKELTQYTQSKLEEYKLNLPTPISILCDASGSMEVCVKTSGIITSLLCAIAGNTCKLYVFKDKNYSIANPPKNVRDVLNFIEDTKAESYTSPASSLNQMILDKMVAKTIILVTDQEENTPCNGLKFAETLKNYSKLIGFNPKIVFITMGKSNQMIFDLENAFGKNLVSEMVSNYNFDLNEPDLRKMDSILAILSETNVCLV